jgi:hypothetical protein
MSQLLINQKMLYFWHGIANGKGIALSDLILIEKAKERQ